MSLQDSKLFFQWLLNSLIHSDLSPDALFSEFVIGTGLRQWTFSDSLTPCSQCLFLACLPVLRNPLLVYGAYGWVGTGSTLASETAKTKSQQEQTLQGLKVINSRNFYSAYSANWNVFKAGFPKKQYCGTKAVHLLKAPSRMEIHTNIFRLQPALAKQCISSTCSLTHMAVGFGQYILKIRL